MFRGRKESRCAVSQRRRINTDSTAFVRLGNPPPHNLKPSMKLWLFENLARVKGSRVYKCGGVHF